MRPALYMVFDVESVGLHGEAFAVGWVVVNADGREIASAEYACDPSRAHGSDEDRQWIAENVHLTENVGSLGRLREFFWEAWVYAHKRGAVLAADVPWPVETNFLSACVAENADERKWHGPYPLIDIASVRLAAGLDPLKTEERRPSEMPAHHPQADARQSARLLLEALALIQGAPAGPVGAGRAALSP